MDAFQQVHGISFCFEKKILYSQVVCFLGWFSTKLYATKIQVGKRHKVEKLKSWVKYVFWGWTKNEEKHENKVCLFGALSRRWLIIQPFSLLGGLGSGILWLARMKGDSSRESLGESFLPSVKKKGMVTSTPPLLWFQILITCPWQFCW